ncbi:hypothetical protein P43SY_006548 [Pythium insidiosum]|uniref:Uncharacterized protein n=1 Tax=Pythium insidiosum TaxID=114742 RepID=A0AAD5Q8Y1_PYTIN|nr:hypothetical protein P43SY_006548 [Pythium insidiosum]
MTSDGATTSPPPPPPGSLPAPAAPPMATSMDSMAAVASPAPASSESVAQTQTHQEVHTPPTTSAIESGGAASSGNSNNGSAQPHSSRKRVFTFQRRWLHSLPIMEKSVPQSVVDGSLKMGGPGLTTPTADDDAKADDKSASMQDVIVCMLCDDPNSGRDVMKIWSRLNCRRGRIENHLMSKHPEFMLLLKQKREAEGDLAVQIFLQNMREGRCNVRSEISAGLYSHMQVPLAMPTSTAATTTLPLTTALTTGNKRSLSGATATSELLKTAAMYAPRASSSSSPEVGSRDAMDAADLESSRKRPKQSHHMEMPPLRDGRDGAELNGHGAQMLRLATMSDVERGQLDTVAAASATTDLPTPTAPLAKKTIIVTGGDKPVVSRLACDLWSLGANVLITFSDMSAMEQFAARIVARFQEEGFQGSERGSTRGIIVPICCPTQSRSQIEEWARLTVAKCAQVECLINFVDDDDEKPKPDAVSGEENDVTRERAKSNADETLSSGAMTCAAVEAMTKTLASDLQSENLQINSIIVQRPQLEHDDSRLEDLETQELAHTALFLMSPLSACLSGSVLRLRVGKSLQPTTASSGSIAPASAPPSAASSEAADEAALVSGAHGLVHAPVDAAEASIASPSSPAEPNDTMRHVV